MNILFVLKAVPAAVCEENGPNGLGVQKLGDFRPNVHGLILHHFFIFRHIFLVAFDLGFAVNSMVSPCFDGDCSRFDLWLPVSRSFLLFLCYSKRFKVYLFLIRDLIVDLITHHTRATCHLFHGVLTTKSSVTRSM